MVCAAEGHTHFARPRSPATRATLADVQTFLARPRLGRFVVALAGAALLAGCSAGDDNVDPDAVTVGVGSTAEQQVLAALTVVALEEAGIATELEVDLGGTVGLRREALRGTVDVYWDYTAAAWALGLRQQSPPSDPEESYERVRQEDRTRNDLIWLEPTQADATLALFVDGDVVDGDQPPSMDWLAAELSGEQRTLCVDVDFRDRPGGLYDLAEVYPMELDRVGLVDATEEEAIALVAEGECFAGLATTTSGEAYAQGLVPVTDDLGVFPAFVVAPVAREAVIEQNPAIEAALEPVIELLDTTTLARLNAEARDADSAEARRELARRELAEHLSSGDGDDGE